MNSKLVLIESHSGAGQLTPRGGGATTKVRYRLGVYQRMLDAGSGEFIPGVRRIEGRISVPNHPLFAIMSIGKYFTLRLSDGRKLDFFFRDQNGSIASTGVGLYTEAA